MPAHSSTTEDLLNAVARAIPKDSPGPTEEMQRYLFRAKKHMKAAANQEYRNELLRAERTNAAHEYGRTIECLALAYEADKTPRQAA